MVERRSSQRSLCADLVTVQIHEGRARRHETVANLEDISRSGACVQMDRKVRPGASVEIICSACRLKGRVRYCRFSDIGYNVGIQFERPNSWNRQRFEPKHLLDVEALLG